MSVSKQSIGYGLIGLLALALSVAVKTPYVAFLLILLGGCAFVMQEVFWGIGAVVFAYVFLPDVLALGAIVGLGIFYLLRKAFLGERLRPVTSGEGVLLAFGLLLIVATFTSTYRSGSLRDLGIHAGGFFLYLMIREEVKDKNRAHILLSLFALAFLFIALYGIRQYFTGVEIKREWVDVQNNPDVKARIFSVFGNPNIFAEYLVMGIPILIAMGWWSKREFKSLVYFAGAGVGMIALGMTLSRGGWIGLLAAAAFFVYFICKRLYLLAIPALMGLVMVLPESILRRFTSITNFADSSTSYRFKIFSITGEVIHDHFLVGVGLGHLPFKRVFETYIRTMPIFHAHNTFLEIFAELGLVGFVLFLILLGTVFHRGHKHLLRSDDAFLKILGTGLLAGLFGVFVHGMFENVIYLTKITMTFWFMVSMVFALSRLQEEERS